MTRVEQITNMVAILPEPDQEMIYELTKRFILAWDPDFTKLTPQEAEELKAARSEIERGVYLTSGEAMEELGIH